MIHYGFESNNIDIINILIKYGCNVHLITRDTFETTLMIACKHGNIKLIELLNNNKFDFEYLINHKKKSDNCMDNYNNAFLTLCQNGSIECLKYLIDLSRKINNNIEINSINIGDNLNDTLCHDVAKYVEKQNSVKVMRLLHNHGFDINAQNANGKSPMDYARECGNELLIECINDINATATEKLGGNYSCDSIIETNHNNNNNNNLLKEEQDAPQDATLGDKNIDSQKEDEEKQYQEDKESVKNNNDQENNNKKTQNNNGYTNNKSQSENIQRELEDERNNLLRLLPFLNDKPQYISNSLMRHRSLRSLVIETVKSKTIIICCLLC